MDNKDISVWVAYTEQANELTSKRQTVNALLLTLTLGILGFCLPNLGLASCILSSFGILCSTLWFFLVRAYRKLNTAKFQVIEKLEEKMSVKPYTEEWTKAKKLRYVSFTRLESAAILLCFFGFIVLLLLSILKMTFVI